MSSIVRRLRAALRVACVEALLAAAALPAVVAAQLAREHGLAMSSDWPMPLLGLDCFVMNVPPDQVSTLATS